MNSTSSSRSARKPLLWLLVLFLVAAAVVWWLWPAATPSKSKPWRHDVPVVKAAVATAADVPVIHTALGTVKANQVVTVTSRVEGQLQKVFFREGQYVEKGDQLAQIDDRAFKATLAQRQATLARDKAQLSNAKQQLQRNQQLSQRGLLSKQQLDTLQSQVAQFAASVKADKAQIEAAQLTLDYATIKAPISGYTGLRLIDAGNLVTSSNNQLVTITQTQPAAVLFSLPQAVIGQVVPTLRQGKTMPLWAINPLNDKKLAKGQLKFASNRIDTATGSVQLKALFANTDNQLYPNQSVRVRLQTRLLNDVVVIPQQAVQLSDAGSYVWQLYNDEKDGKAITNVTKVSIKTGVEDGDKVVVTQGLQAGDRLVVLGTDNLRDGRQVQLGQVQVGKEAADHAASDHPPVDNSPSDK